MTTQFFLLLKAPYHHRASLCKTQGGHIRSFWRSYVVACRMKNKILWIQMSHLVKYIGWCIKCFLFGAQTPTRVHKSIKELNPSFKTKLKRKGKCCSWNKEKCIACELFSYWTQGAQITYFSTVRTACTTDLLCSKFKPSWVLSFFLCLWFCRSHHPVL